MLLLSQYHVFEPYRKYNVARYVKLSANGDSLTTKINWFTILYYYYYSVTTYTVNIDVGTLPRPVVGKISP
jgi:hypothetical protein